MLNFLLSRLQKGHKMKYIFLLFSFIVLLNAEIQKEYYL